MDILTFVAELAKAFVWPVFILIFILLLRKPIRDLIRLLTRFKYKDFELEFRRKIEEVEAEAVIELREKEPLDAFPHETEKHIYKLAEISPRAAVLEAWRTVENEAIETVRADVKQQQGAEPAIILPRVALKHLEQSERIDRQTSALIRDLRSLRNEAAHAPEFALGSDSALEYASAAYRLARKFKQMRGV
jgi:DNA-directed RNA polymerase subunit F